MGGATAVILLTALAACSDDGEARPGAPATTTSTRAVAETTTTRLQVRTIDAGISLPRSFTSDGVRFELTKVEFSNASPATYLDESPEPIAGELLYVSFAATFETGSAADPVEWRVQDFHLVTGTGRTITASGVDFESYVTVSPGATTTSAVVFPATKDDLAGARFRLDDGANPPAEIPLDGPADQ